MAQLSCPLALQAQQQPEAIALLQRLDQAAPIRWSYRQLHGAVSQRQQWLTHQGAQPGQHLTVISHDKTELLLLLFAALRLGLVLIPINPAFPADQRQRLIVSCDTDYLVADCSNLDLPDGCKPLIPEPLTPVNVGTAVISTVPVYAPAAALSGIFTSGTTGLPKLALHSYTNHSASAAGSRTLIDLQPDDGWALSLPLYHIGGIAIIFRSILAGASLIIPATSEPLIELLTEPRLTHLSAVATQLQQLRQHGGDLVDSGLKQLLVGGSAVPASLLSWLQAQVDQRPPDRPLRCNISYGLTELSSQVMTGPINPTGALATRLPHCQLQLSGDGEIQIKGESLFLGYFGQRPIEPGSWFHTRDLGRLDSAGALTLIGRVDNQFISGGENIQPETIEAQIRQYPGVEECVVVPLADPQFGFRPVAFIAPVSIDSQPLARWLQQRLAKFLCPDHYLPLLNPDHPDRTALKRSRQQLQQQAQRVLASR